ncbi:hypothetical protein QFZ80_001310 [Paenibacillus sp. V4I7]|nr:hypothetical protein [Paenibacillus sp. V4I7]
MRIRNGLDPFFEGCFLHFVQGERQNNRAKRTGNQSAYHILAIGPEEVTMVGITEEWLPS